MPTLTNSFEGGSNGTTITTGNSGGTSGNAFDSVTIAGSNTLTFATTAAMRGSLGVSIGIPASSGQAAYVAWTTSLTASATSATLYSRIKVKYAAAPATAVPILRGVSAGSQRWRVSVTTGLQVQIANAANTTIATSTMTLATGTAYRIEVAAAASTSGTIEVRIYVDESTTISETMGPYAAQALGGPVAEIRYGVAASIAPASSMTIISDDYGASTVTWLGPAGPVPAVTLNWCGEVTQTGGYVTYATANITSAKLAVSTAGDLSGYTTGAAVAPDSDGVVKLFKGSLTQGTAYYYGLEADGVLMTAANSRGQFRTLPTAGTQFSHTTIFGSCQQTDSNATTFSVMASYTDSNGAPFQNVHLGDYNYRDFDSTTTQATMVAAYKSGWSQTNVVTWTSKRPTHYTWDNHDWFGPDSHAGSGGAAQLKTVYRQFAPTATLPADSSGGGTGGVWRSWVVGRVRYIMLDTRSQRSPRTDPDGPSKTLLGSEQKTWFKAELLQPEPVKVILCGIYWRFDSVNGDRWGSYYTEWTELKNFIQSNGVNVVAVHGDRHALNADNGTSTGCYIPIMGGAPFDQGSTAAFESWTAGYYDTGGTNMKALGALKVTDAGNTITLDYGGFTQDDTVTPKVSMSTVFTVSSTIGNGWGTAL